jgi:TolB-like protein
VNLFTELKRRNVFRVAAAYAVLSWLLLQVGDVLFETLELPAVWSKGLLAILVLGLAPALIFSWVYELTPEGLRKESEIDQGESVTAHTARRLDLAVITLLILAIGLFFYQGFVAERTPTEVLSEKVATEQSSQQTAAPRTPEATEDLRSVAVLPFADLSPEGDQEFFADGIAEEILNTLVRVPELKVAARTSSFQFKGNNRNIIDIGHQLGVSTVLEGSVRKSGDRVRITAQLINVADGFHLWSQSYDEAIADLFMLQNRISRQIAGALSIQLESLVIQRSGGTTNPAAFDALVRGRHAFAERHLPGQRREGIEQFALATVMDPAYATAWAHYAYSMSISSPDVIDLDVVAELKLIRSAVDQALRLEPGNPLALVVRGKLQLQDFELEAGLETLRALTINYPSFVEGQYSFATALGQVGRNDEALATMRRVLALDPLNLTRKRVYSEFLMYSGRFEEAWRVLDDVASLGGESDYFLALVTFQLMANRNGNWKDLVEEQERMLQSRLGTGGPDDRRADYFSRLQQYLESDDPSVLQSHLGRFDWMATTPDDFALYYLWTDESIEEAVSALMQAIADRDLLGGAADWFLQPAFNIPDSVRNHPSYALVWESPEMQRFARVRIANGALQAIPQVVIDAVQVK